MVLKQRDINYLLLTGSTPVDIRQSLVDEFTEDDTITVFLLSTKAGGESRGRYLRDSGADQFITGMGINLTAASVVIMQVSVPSLFIYALTCRTGLIRTSIHTTIVKRKIERIELGRNAMSTL